MDLVSQTVQETYALFSSQENIEWKKNYSGVVNGGHDCELDLAFDGFNCKGLLTILSSNEETYLEGSMENNELILVEKHEGLPFSYVNGRLSNSGLMLEWQPIGASYVYQASFVEGTDFTPKGQAVFRSDKDERIEESNYLDIYLDKKVDVPFFEDQDFNNWMESKIDLWNSQIQSKQIDSQGAFQEKLYAEIDHQIHFVNERFINGELFFLFSWGAGKESISFLYDKKRKALMGFTDIFKSESELFSLVKLKMMTKMRSNNLEKVEGYFTWLNSAKIQGLIITNTGIKIRTVSDAIYGTQEVELNENELQPLLKKRYWSSFQNIINPKI